MTRNVEEAGRMYQVFEDYNEQAFADEFGGGMTAAVRMAVATIAAVIAVGAAAYGLHVANERMASDPMEVVD